MKTNFASIVHVAVLAIRLLRWKPRKRTGYHFVTRLVALVLALLIAFPMGALATNCNDDSCECGVMSNGGDESDGNANGSDEECDDCQNEEDQNQNDANKDPVALGGTGGFASTWARKPVMKSIRSPGGANTATLGFGLFHFGSGRGIAPGDYVGKMGRNWTHNYNVHVEKRGGGGVLVRTWNGTEKTFTRNGDGTYSGDGKSVLVSNDVTGNYEWSLPHGTKYTFDSTKSNRLATIHDRNTNAVTLSYDSNYILSGVTDTPGRALTIRTNPAGLIGETVDPIGRTNKFYYDAQGRLTNISDALGSRATYGYDASSARITKFTNARNKTHEYSYDGVGRVIGETNALGKVQTYARDEVARTITVNNAKGGAFTVANNSAGKFVSIQRATGTKQVVRDNSGRPTQTTSPGGGVTSVVYGNAPSCGCGIHGGKTQVTDPIGRVKKFGYDSTFNFRNAYTNASGEYQLWTHDAKGNKTSHTTARGHTTVYVPDSVGNRTKHIDPYNRTNNFFYDVYGNMTNSTDALGRVTKFSYDLVGRLTNRVDAMNRTNKFTYDVRDRLTKRINALGHSNTWTYDGEGKILGHTNELGNVTTYTYNDGGQKTSVKLPGSSSVFESYDYDANRNRIAVTNALGKATRYGYDAVNRLTTVTNALNHVWSYGYNADNHRTSTVDPVGRTNTFAYDLAGQMTSMTLPGATTPFETYGYDLDGNRVAVTNALGQVTRYGYDADDHLTSITNALTNVWRFAYDAVGLRTNSVDPNLHTNRYTYDAAGQLTAVTNALSQGVRFQYDLVGNRTNLIDAKDQAVGFGYDAMNRLTNIVYAPGDLERFEYDAAGNLSTYFPRDGGSAINFGYDSANRLTSKYVSATYNGFADYEYDAAGRLTLIAADDYGYTNRLEFGYDAAGRLTNETSTFHLGSPLSVKYEYDATGRRSKLIYPDTTFVTYEYNTNGWLTSIKDGGTNAIVTYEYDSAGRRVKRTLQNSTFTLLDYDAAGQITNIHHKVISGGSTNTLSQYRYGYDAAGQRTWVKRANGKGDVYKYDAIDQLTNVLYEATNPDTTPSAWTNEARYVFDAAGNRSSVTYTNSGTTSYTVNALNQYTDVGGTPLSYDMNGNLDDNPGWSYGYDSENRLREAYGEAWYEYAWYYHDGLGRLAAAESPTWGITRFVYDSEWRVIAEYDENSEETTLVAKYVYGPEIDEPLRMQRDGTNYYYHAAALGTVMEITGGTGTLLEQYRYDVYGEPTFLSSTGTQLSTSAIGNRFLFQGRDRDPDTGLYNFRHRYYSPTLGRFVQKDPIGVRGGINLYTFVLNSPQMMIDVYGFAGVICVNCNCDGKYLNDWTYLSEKEPPTEDDVAAGRSEGSKFPRYLPKPGECVNADAIYYPGGAIKIGDLGSVEIDCSSGKPELDGSFTGLFGDGAEWKWGNETSPSGWRWGWPDRRIPPYSKDPPIDPLPPLNPFPNPGLGDGDGGYTGY